MTPAEPVPGTITPGTPMLKAIPPLLLEPYLNGQRSVIAGYIYRAQDCSLLRRPAEFFQALALGYPGSEFRPDMPEIWLLRWPALAAPGSLVPPLPGGRSPAGGPAATVPEFFSLPVPIPIGAEIHRLTADGLELMARYDGQSWLRSARRQ